jgi:hypothetical protein
MCLTRVLEEILLRGRTSDGEWTEPNPTDGNAEQRLDARVRYTILNNVGMPLTDMTLDRK